MTSAALLTTLALLAGETAPVSIGSRLELLVDQHVVELLRNAELRLHRPARREIVFRTDAAWEGNASAFQSLVRDGDRYRLYCRGLHYRTGGPETLTRGDHPWFLCVAESSDGIQWSRPELGLHEFAGSRANNIVLTPASLTAIGGDPAHTAVFLDTNPTCAPDARYKCIVVGSKPTGMYVLKSADGLRFELMSREPIQTEGAFDSQNLAFWDPTAGCYREYHRGFAEGVRAILTASSAELVSFPKPSWVTYEDSPPEHLYTNAVQPYHRAPHILMGFPMRYVERDWSDALLALPGRQERLARAAVGGRYGYALTDALFMTSRDGLRFKRWGEAFIRPGPRERESWVYGDNFVVWGMSETASAVEDAPPELSLYATEGYWEGTSTAIRRYTLRLDGFVSAHAPLVGGEVITRPVVFEGGNLVLNAETSAAGGIQVELQRPDGSAIPGYSLAECPPVIGDRLRHVVRWQGVGGDVRSLAGQPVRLRFVLRDADLYAFQFGPYQPEPERPLGLLPGQLPPKQPGRGPFTVVDEHFAAASLERDGMRSGWEVRQGVPGRVARLAEEPPGSGRAGGPPYLRIERRQESRGEGGALWLVLGPQDAADTTGSIVDLTARIWVPSANQARVDIDAFDSAPEEFTRRAFQLRLGPDGTVYHFRGVDVPVPGLQCEPDSWQELKLRADCAAGTFDVTVGGRTARGLPFATDTHRIQSVYFGPNAARAALYLRQATLTVSP